MLAAVIIISLLAILIILFLPRRNPYVRRIAKSYNGQHYGKERELH